MKLFKIYKKVRELKRQEKELEANIERLEKQLDKGWLDYYKLRTELYGNEGIILHNIRESRQKAAREQAREQKSYERSRIYRIEEELNEREQELNEREQELNEREQEREQELNDLQRKLNDQILKLGIVNGVNK